MAGGASRELAGAALCLLPALWFAYLWVFPRVGFVCELGVSERSRRCCDTADNSFMQKRRKESAWICWFVHRRSDLRFLS